MTNTDGDDAPNTTGTTSSGGVTEVHIYGTVFPIFDTVNDKSNVPSQD